VYDGLSSLSMKGLESPFYFKKLSVRRFCGIFSVRRTTCGEVA
jgi:hypothetical protein